MCVFFDNHNLPRRLRRTWTIVGLGIIAVLFSCCASRDPAEIVALSGEGSVLDGSFRRAKYDALLDNLAEIMARDVENPIFLEYGPVLAGHREHNADELTVDCELYWAGVSAMKFWDPRMLYARILTLMRDGRIDLARNILLFTTHAWWYQPEGARKDLHQFYMGEIGADLENIFNYTTPLTDHGRQLIELRLWNQAISKFDAVLSDFPNSARALTGKAIALDAWSWEIGDPEKRISASELYRRARYNGPFRGHAYRNLEDSGRTALLVNNHIVPDLEAIWSWMDPSQVEYSVLYRFAGNCRFIGAEEYSFYAIMMAIEQISLFRDADPRYAMWEAADILRSMGKYATAEIFLESHKRLFLVNTGLF